MDVDTTQQVTDWTLVIRSNLDPRPALRDLGDSPCDEVGAEAGDSVGGVTHEDHHVSPLLHLPSSLYMSQMLYAGQSDREDVTFLVTSSSCKGHSSCIRSMKF